MNSKTISKHLARALSLLSLGLFFSTAVDRAFAADEDSLFADFQKSVVAADPKLAQEAAMREHPNPPTEQELEKFVKALANAAASAMDRGKELEQQYPQSKYLPAVRSKLEDTLGNVFGVYSLPVPKDRAADLEVCIRGLLSRQPGDTRLYFGLCNLAASLPLTNQLAIYQELSHDPTPPPVRSKAQQALLNCERLGKPLDLTFTALDGQAIRMGDFTNKVVILDFWATTCPPCVRKLPELKELYAKYKSQGLEVIGVSLDTEKDKLTRFIHENKLPWPQYFDAAGSDSPMAKSFGIAGIPVVWLVDRHGLLRNLDARFDTEDNVRVLLKEQ
jgi:peroxiredoxin